MVVLIATVSKTKLRCCGNPHDAKATSKLHTSFPLMRRFSDIVQS